MDDDEVVWMKTGDAVREKQAHSKGGKELLGTLVGVLHYTGVDRGNGVKLYVAHSPYSGGMSLQMVNLSTISPSEADPLDRETVDRLWQREKNVLQQKGGPKVVITSLHSSCSGQSNASSSSTLQEFESNDEELAYETLQLEKKQLELQQAQLALEEKRLMMKRMKKERI